MNAATSPKVPPRPKIPNKPRNLTNSHQFHVVDSLPPYTNTFSGEPGPSSETQPKKTNHCENRITKRVTVNPELSISDINNQEEYNDKKKKIIERLKQLKEEQAKSNHNFDELIMAQSGKKLSNEELLQLFDAPDNHKDTATSRKLPPPPRPKTTPSVKHRINSPVSSTQITPSNEVVSTSDYFSIDVPNNPSQVDALNSPQDSILIDASLDDDDPYSSIDYTNKTVSKNETSENVANVSNVDLLCFDLNGTDLSTKDDSVNLSQTSDEKLAEPSNLSSNENERNKDNASPMPAPRKLTKAKDPENEDVYAVVKKTRASKKTKTVDSENTPKSVSFNENEHEFVEVDGSEVKPPPPVPVSRPPLSDYGGIFDDDEKNLINNGKQLSMYLYCL